MADFGTLLRDLEQNRDRPEEFLSAFFTPDHFRDYDPGQGLEEEQIKAVRIMFESKKDLLKRSEQALKTDPLCPEAFFVYYLLSEDVFVDYRFRSYYSHISDFGDLSDHQKKSFLRILEFYVEFLTELHNHSGAIRVQRQIMRLRNREDGLDLDRLSYLYATIEDADDFYRLYLDRDFGLDHYLLLIVTLLKHEDRLKASQVVRDMFEHVEYATYLDHLWDLDEKDEKQQEFYQKTEDCYEFISSIPDFFTFIAQVHESLKES